MELVQKILKGDVRAAARLMTMIENGDAEARAALKSLYAHTGSAHIIGITGPPGSGKSTLADRLTEELRKRDKTVGIVAVDPTSPFTGGAILADRIRMQSHSLDTGVFIRSMATRGHLGGLARATNEIVDVMDAAGKEVILIETVGVGQDEVEVVGTAHTCVVVSVPGLGDEVQTLKAGILEIGDLFVVNKADREGASRTATELEMMLHMAPEAAGWSPKILKTVATTGEGVAALLDAIFEHKVFMDKCDLRKQKGRARSERVFVALLQERLTARALERFEQNGGMKELIARVADRALDPYTAVDEVLAKIGL
ncbi:methylmalonyl Co-A mutase-associated GTPase MeaB [Candidatus Methylomirabilis limnetica]|jgi:LAO/AO transport system kinase|uniref:Methylmalonyl Co-A mutase-associated GTPase MeaB n=1 Tax=Candidatus Methylomirabilis limnetica TaxID=2033718 RepID=A0A2T4TZC5_9BACT|nr:methylmalonyl Co-A mutase-associated GTPase MeaB [Candidatus Methylomirabilis limnetica]PTL36463.1 methylmalonyl Co-A mutase-associated GTPase MeaB [Candidatus Methylomirabilis limnetica]